MLLLCDASKNYNGISFIVKKYLGCHVLSFYVIKAMNFAKNPNVNTSTRSTFCCIELSYQINKWYRDKIFYIIQIRTHYLDLMDETQ